MNENATKMSNFVWCAVKDPQILLNKQNQTEPNQTVPKTKNK